MHTYDHIPPLPPPSLFSTPDLYPLGDLTGKYKQRESFSSQSFLYMDKTLSSVKLSRQQNR